jgi:hypothetical protein
MKYTSQFVGLAALSLSGCTSPQPRVMAPPVSQNPPAMSMPAPQMNNPSMPAVQNGGGMQTAQGGSAWDWNDVPANQNIPITRAVFDQGGYQLYAASGETITVPFANQNMYVMKFGKTNSEMYFINENGAPTLYLPNNGYLENAAAQGAHWYPFPKDFSYQRPVYMGLAPTWGDYVAMGWYPGMMYHGGYWGYNPWRAGLLYSPMPGLYVNIGGRPYYGWGSYNTYYHSTPYNRVIFNSRPSYSYNSVGRRAPGTGSFGRSSGGTGSFGRSAASRSTGGGGFSAARPSGSTGSFGGSNRTSGGFGGGSTNRTFGGGSTNKTSGGFSSNRPAFGSGGSGSRPAFGGGSAGYSSGARRTGSFGNSSSGYSSSRPSFGSSSSSSGGFGSRSSSSGGLGSSSSGRSSGGFSSSGRSSGGFGGGGGSFGRSSGGFGGGRRR